MLMNKNRRLRVTLGTLESANLLFLKLLFRNRQAARVYPGFAFREYVYLAGGERWKCGTIFEFMPEIADQPLRIVLEHLPGGGLIAPVNELALMAMVTKALQPENIFEIGTYRGRTALNFALNSPPDCRVFTLDLPDTAAESTDDPSAVHAADAGLIEMRSVGVEYAGKDVAPKITQLVGDSRTFDYSAFSGRMDLVFVDGGHTYDTVVSDTKAALRLCRPGGVILWHDFANYGDYHDVTRAVLDLLGGDNIFQLEDSQVAGYRKPS